MFKVLVLLILIAAVYSVPAPPAQTQLNKRSQVKPIVDASIKAINGEIDPKNENEELEGAEFGWKFKKWGWGYPIYKRYYYPSYYSHYPSYYYPSYSSYWW